jgi:hypothetical protein
LGLLIAVVSAVAHRSGRDEARRTAVTMAGMSYRPSPTLEAVVMTRDAAEPVTESAGLRPAAPTLSPIIQSVAARSNSRAEELPHGDRPSHDPRPLRGPAFRRGLTEESRACEAVAAAATSPPVIVVSLSKETLPQAATAAIPVPTRDVQPATDRNPAQPKTAWKAPAERIEAAAEPFAGSPIRDHDPRRSPTGEADQPWCAHDCRVGTPCTTPADAMVGQEHRGGGGLNHRSSTFHEGVARGCADVPRAMGQCRQQSAWALRNLQEAYGHALDNRKKAVQTYFDIIRINQQERARQRRPRPTCEQLREYARVRAPERLAAHEFDSAAGTLVWPGVLQGSQFAAERGAIDRLMTDRARSGGNTGDAAAKVKLLLAGLKIKLKQQIWTLSSMDYIAAQRFLAGVEQEACPRAPEIAASVGPAKLAAK